jgi:hypothetical protein
MASLQQQIDQLRNDLSAFNESFFALQQSANELRYYLDVGWVLLSSSFIISMQSGFILLEIGGARVVHQKISLIKVIHIISIIISFKIF